MPRLSTLLINSHFHSFLGIYLLTPPGMCLAPLSPFPGMLLAWLPESAPTTNGHHAHPCWWRTSWVGTHSFSSSLDSFMANFSIRTYLGGTLHCPPEVLLKLRLACSYFGGRKRVCSWWAVSGRLEVHTGGKPDVWTNWKGLGETKRDAVGILIFVFVAINC